MKSLFIIISLLFLTSIKSITVTFDIKTAETVGKIAQGDSIILKASVGTDEATTSVTLAEGNLALQKSDDNTASKTALNCPTTAQSVTESGIDITCTASEAISTAAEYVVVAGATALTSSDFTVAYGTTKLTVSGKETITASIKAAKTVTSLATTDTVDITVKGSTEVAEAITFAEGNLALSIDGTTKIDLTGCTATANPITTSGVDITCKPKSAISTNGSYGLYLGSATFTHASLELAVSATPVITIGTSQNNNQSGSGNDTGSGSFIKSLGIMLLYILF